MGRNLGKPLPPVLGRMCEAYGIDPNLKALAARLSVPYGTVKNWHARDAVPTEWVMKVAEDTGSSFETLMRGHPALDEKAEVKASSPAFDAELLDQVLGAVLAELDARNVELPRDKLSRLVSLIYEYEANQRNVTATVTTDRAVRHTTERFLRLVA